MFDIQDVGARFYTYIWTMYDCMVAASLAGVRFVVLDRPNPIGGDRGATDRCCIPSTPPSSAARRSPSSTA